VPLAGRYKIQDTRYKVQDTSVMGRSTTERQKSGVRRKGLAFIMISAGWILLAMIWAASRLSFELPSWIPDWLFVIGFSTFVVVLLLGWVLPLAIGLRLLRQAKLKPKQPTT
jgi:hypothetical protein